MISSSLKSDFQEFLDRGVSFTGYMLFLKHNPEARELHKQLTNEDFLYLEMMSDDEIRRRYDKLDEICKNSPDYTKLVPIHPLIDYLEQQDKSNNKTPSRKFVNDFEDILRFQAGIPSVCNILIGNTVEDGWVAAIQDHETNDYAIDSALKAYDAFIEPSLDYDGTVDGIDIKMPLCDWSYDDIQELYFYVSKNFRYDDRKASFSLDRNDEVNEVDILLYNALYKITISIEENFGEKSLKISIIRQMDEIETYQALNTLLSMDKPNPRVYVTIEEILHVLYSRLKANDKNE